MDVAAFESRLRTAWLGRESRWSTETPSTMELAWRAAAEGAPSGTLVVTGRQSQGRGRGGRRWLSGSGGAVLFSLFLKVSGWMDMGKVNLGMAVAVCEAVEMVVPELRGGRLGIKWPNDVWVDGRKKLAGILVDVDQGSLNVGVGINANNDIEAEIESTATSLSREAGREVNREHILAEICNQMEDLLNMEFKQLMEKYLHHEILIGQQIVVMPKRIEDTGSHYVAKAIGYDGMGFLLVERHLMDDTENPSISNNNIFTLSGEEVSVRPYLDSLLQSTTPSQ